MTETTHVKPRRVLDGKSSFPKAMSHSCPLQQMLSLHPPSKSRRALMRPTLGPREYKPSLLSVVGLARFQLGKTVPSFRLVATHAGTASSSRPRHRKQKQKQKKDQNIPKGPKTDNAVSGASESGNEGLDTPA